VLFGYRFPIICEVKMIIHILWHGKALCGQPGLPCEWPVDHKWVGLPGLPDVKEQDVKVREQGAWCVECLAQFQSLSLVDVENLVR
jgi:hypothetical protein